MRDLLKCPRGESHFEIGAGINDTMYSLHRERLGVLEQGVSK